MIGHATRLIDRYFAGVSSLRQEERMRGHLRSCADCRAYYDSQVAIERALLACGSDLSEASTGLTPEALRRIANSVTRKLNSPPRRPWLGWKLPLVAALATAAGLAALLPRAPEIPPSAGLRIALGTREFTLRGFEHSEQATRGFGLRMVCVHPDDVDDVETARQFDVRELRDGDACSQQDVLFLAWSNHHDRYRHLYVVGVSDDGAIHDYYPRPGEARSLRAEPGLSDVVLGYGIILGKRHRPGRVTLVAWFSEAPLTRSHVVELLSQVGPPPGEPNAAQVWSERLARPGSNIVVRTLRVRGDQ